MRRRRRTSAARRSAAWNVVTAPEVHAVAAEYVDRVNWPTLHERLDAYPGDGFPVDRRAAAAEACRGAGRSAWPRCADRRPGRQERLRRRPLGRPADSVPHRCASGSWPDAGHGPARELGRPHDADSRGLRRPPARLEAGHGRARAVLPGIARCWSSLLGRRPEAITCFKDPADKSEFFDNPRASFDVAEDGLAGGPTCAPPWPFCWRSCWLEDRATAWGRQTRRTGNSAVYMRVACPRCCGGALRTTTPTEPWAPSSRLGSTTGSSLSAPPCERSSVGPRARRHTSRGPCATSWRSSRTVPQTHFRITWQTTGEWG